jgi:hypothetical protein
MPFDLRDDENYQRTQRDLAALGPEAVAVLKRYLAGAPASEVPAPMVQAAYDILDRLGVVRQSPFVVQAPALVEGTGSVESEDSGPAT